jgi:hypothetical protein
MGDKKIIDKSKNGRYEKPAKDRYRESEVIEKMERPAPWPDPPPPRERKEKK